MLLGNDAAAVADGDRVGPGTGLELREQVAHVRLDRLLREEEALADLAVDEAVATSWSTSISRIVGSCSSSRIGAVNGITSALPFGDRLAAAASKRRLWSI